MIAMSTYVSDSFIMPRTSLWITLDQQKANATLSPAVPGAAFGSAADGRLGGIASCIGAASQQVQ